MAADAIDEWLGIIEFVQRTRPHDAAAAELRGPGRSIHLHATDTRPNSTPSGSSNSPRRVSSGAGTTRGDRCAARPADRHPARLLPPTAAGRRAVGGAGVAGAAGLLAGAGDLRLAGVPGQARPPPSRRTGHTLHADVRCAVQLDFEGAAATHAEEHGSAADHHEGTGDTGDDQVSEFAPVSARLRYRPRGTGRCRPASRARRCSPTPTGSRKASPRRRARKGVSRASESPRPRATATLVGLCRGRRGQLRRDVLVEDVPGLDAHAVRGVGGPVLGEVTMAPFLVSLTVWSPPCGRPLRWTPGTR